MTEKKKASKTSTKAPAPKGRPVLVTTENRGVFFGYTEDKPGETMTLKAARNCLYWSRDTKGFLGLTTTGPSAGCRVGPPTEELFLLKVTSVAAVSAEAAEAWEKAPWSS